MTQVVLSDRAETLAPQVSAKRRDDDGPVVLPSIREWESREFKGIVLTEADRAFVARMEDSREGRVTIDELRTGLRVRAKSWVGVIRLECAEIRIVPKLAGDDVGLVRLLEFTSGLEGLSRLQAEASLDTDGDGLLDLIALLFAEATEQLIRRGILTGYVEREEDLPVVRGRILFDRQVLQRFGQLDRIACRFDELENDIDDNRLVAAALQVASRFVRDPATRRKLARLRSVFEAICDPTLLDLAAFRSGASYDRLNSHYEQTHALAWLLLDGLGIQDLFSVGTTRSFAFLLNMNVLFERFVELLISRVLSSRDYSVEAQGGHTSVIWNAAADRHYSRVIPDLLVSLRGAGGTRLPIDSKYKLYDSRRVDSGDVYQMFLYAYALGTKGPGVTPRALLLYPASQDERTPIHLKVRPLNSTAAAEIIGMAIPIPAALMELEEGATGAICSELRGAIDTALGRDRSCEGR